MKLKALSSHVSLFLGVSHDSLPGRPTWEMAKRYCAIGKWRMPSCIKLPSLGGEIWICCKLSEPQELGKCYDFLFPCLVPLFVSWLRSSFRISTAHVAACCEQQSRLQPRLCDISLANCTNALAINADVDSWISMDFLECFSATNF